MVQARENLIGAYAFLFGVIFAIILGIFKSLNPYIKSGNFFYSTLVIIGLIIGLLITGDKNSPTLLFASLSIVLVGSFGKEPLTELTQKIDQVSIIVDVIREVMISLQFLFVPVTIIIALKTVFSTSNI